MWCLCLSNHLPISTSKLGTTELVEAEEDEEHEEEEAAVGEEKVELGKLEILNSAAAPALPSSPAGPAEYTVNDSLLNAAWCTDAVYWCTVPLV